MCETRMLTYAMSYNSYPIRLSAAPHGPPSLTTLNKGITLRADLYRKKSRQLPFAAASTLYNKILGHKFGVYINNSDSASPSFQFE